MRTQRLTTKEVVRRAVTERRNEAASREKPQRMPIVGRRSTSGLLR